MTTPRQLSGAVRRSPLPFLILMGLACDLATRYLAHAPEVARLILLLTLLAGGLPVVVGTMRGDFAADIVASLAIIGALVTEEYLAGCVIVLMQTGGDALEAHARHRASSTLETLLARAPGTRGRVA